MSGNTRKLLVPLATMAVAAAVTIGSGATWTSEVPSTTIATAGVLEATGNGATLSISNMKPGDTRTGTLTITNTGSIPANIALAETVNTVTHAFVGNDLTIEIKRDGQVIYPDGPFGGLNSALTAGDVTNNDPLLAVDDPATTDDETKTTFTFAVTLIAAADEADQDATANVDYDFTFTPVDGDSVDLGDFS